jgi:hypothetical protein
MKKKIVHAAQPSLDELGSVTECQPYGSVLTTDERALIEDLHNDVYAGNV